MFMRCFYSTKPRLAFLKALLTALVAERSQDCQCAETKCQHSVSQWIVHPATKPFVFSMFRLKPHMLAILTNASIAHSKAACEVVYTAILLAN